MQVTIQREQDRAVVHLRGELDAISCGEVFDEVRSATPGPSHVVLNLQGVRFIDSTGMDAIVRISKALAEEGGALAISNPSAFCRNVMEMVGINRLVPILASDDAAFGAASEETPGAS